MKKDHIDISYGYMRPALTDLDSVIAQASNLLAGIKFDGFVGIGVSGAIVVPVLGRALGKHWAVARKKDDGSHSPRAIEGRLGRRWVFVDDLIDTGTTLERVKEVVLAEAEDHDVRTAYVGAYLYNPLGSWSDYTENWNPAKAGRNA